MIGIIFIVGAGIFVMYRTQNNIAVFPIFQENLDSILLPQGDPVVIGLTGAYLYQYQMLTQSCDLHWLRFRIQYECGMLPDSLTSAYPYHYIYFYNQLDKTQEICLGELMKLEDVCGEPNNVICKIYADISPSSFESNMIWATNYKPMYYSNGTRVYFILFNDASSRITNLENMFKSMWTIECQ